MLKQPHPLVELVKSRLREFYREPAVVFWVFGFPLLMAVGLGIAFRAKPPELPMIAIAGQAPKAEALLSSSEVSAKQMPLAEAMLALKNARVDLVVRQSGEVVDYVFDPAQSKSPLAQRVVDDILQSAANTTPKLSTRSVVSNLQGGRYIDFLIPGLIGLNLMGSSMWGVGYNLVVARKRKLLRRYAVTPMVRWHFLLSYFISRCLFLAFELTTLVLFGYLAFGAEVQGSLGLLALFGVFGAASFAGISLMIGARVENTETANGWMNLVQMPMWVFGGAFFSYERFPEWTHQIIQLLPLAALTDALRAIYSAEASLTTLLVPALVLLTWGCAGFAFALKSFRWQ